MQLSEVIRQFAETFRKYESIHRNKTRPDREKIRANAEMATFAEVAYFHSERVEKKARALMTQIETPRFQKLIASDEGLALRTAELIKDLRTELHESPIAD